MKKLSLGLASVLAAALGCAPAVLGQARPEPAASTTAEERQPVGVASYQSETFKPKIDVAPAKDLGPAWKGYLAVSWRSTDFHSGLLFRPLATSTPRIGLVRSRVSSLRPLTTNNRSFLAGVSPTAANKTSGIVPLVFTCPAASTCWVGGASGVWSSASNWSNGAPTSGTNALIDNGNANGQGASVVTLDITGGQAANLTVDADDSLTFNHNTNLTVNGGTISNAGKIAINGGGATNTQLFLGASTMLQGGGTVTLSTTTSGGGAAFIQGNTFNLTNTNNTIQGDGIIGNGSLTVVNQAGGTIDANSTGGALSLGLSLNGSGNVTNAGLLEATNNGVLAISNTVNNTGGNITANGASAIVEVVGGDIQGGTLNTIASGTLETPGGSSATLDGSTQGALTLSTGSTYTSPLNTTTNILGTINNNGNFQVNGGSATNTHLTLAGNTKLQGTGTGTVTLSTIASGGGIAFIDGSGFTLTNTNNKIQGAGEIGNGSLTLVNQATIDANSSAGIGVLILNGSGGVTNTSLLEATNGGTLSIQNGVNNNGGNITANGGTVSFMGANIAGGTLNSLNSGILETPTGSSATLDGNTHGALTLSTGSTYTSPLNSTTNILGMVNNNGNIQVNGGSATNSSLTLAGNTTLQGAGGGTVTLSTIISGGGAAFIKGDTFTLTNANNTIQGDGVIGQGSLTLVNQSGGTINANSTGAGGQSLGVTLNGSGGVSNAGLLEATGTGVLAILNTVNNAAGTGGNITANGGTVALENATIQGGTLTNNGGLLETPTSFGGTVLDGRSVIQGGQGTLTINGTYTSDFNSNTTILGTINNKGNIVVNGGKATNSSLILGTNTAPNLSLQGGGTITLNTTTSGGGAAFIKGDTFTLTNTNNTIQGDGVIGQGSLALVNQAGGTINANSTGGALSLGLSLNGSGNVTNAGLLEATNSGVLAILNTVNNTGGNITANGAATQVQVVGGDIQGGTLNTVNGGTMQTPGGNSATLDGSTQGALTLSTGSTYTSPLNTTTNILGTINNNGNFQVNGGSATNTFLKLAGNTTLQGTGVGTVTLSTIASGGGAAFIQGNGFTLMNTNNTIQGAGEIGQGSLKVVNQATIDANTSAGIGAIVLNGSGGITNANLLEATKGGVLVINNTINNTGGNITANGTGSQVQVVGGDIQGGTLNTLAGGAMNTPSANSATLDGSTQGALTLSTGSTYTSPLNTTTNILGTINNKGTFQVNGGSATNSSLTLTGNTMLSGGGNVTLSSITSGGGAAFIKGDTFTLTNTNNTIQGDGVIGQGSLALVNQAGGTINANSTAGTMDTGLGLNGSGNVTNAGLLEATNNGLLAIQNTVNNTGGNITANGAAAQVQVTGAIQGGTLNTLSGGTMQTPGGNSATLDGNTRGPLTISTGSTYTSPLNSQTFVLGSINDKGNIQVNGGSATNTELTLSGNTTLSGGGKVTLSTVISGGGAAFLQGNGFTLTNANNTIQGDGIIGNGSLKVINQGTISANSPGGTMSTGLTLNGSGGLTNSGTLQVTSGASSPASMHVTNGPFTNFSGTTLTGGTYNVSGATQPGTLQIDELGSTGGEIVTNAANIILNGPMSAFIDAAGKDALVNFETNAPSSSFTITGGRNFTTNPSDSVAGNFTNNGTLTVGSGSTFDVKGNLTNFNSATGTLTGGTYNISGTLQFNNANIKTNAANITLSGGAAHIFNQSSVNALTNFTNNASGASFTINGGANFTAPGAFSNGGSLTVGSSSTFNSAAGNYTNSGSTNVQNGGVFVGAGTLANTGAFTNAGMLEAATGKTLDLHNGTYTDTGGTILASGASTQVLLDGSTISGGTLTDNSGGTIVGENSATLDGSSNAVTLSTGSALQVNNGQTLQAKGTITDNGAITLNSTGALTQLLLTANTTLKGTGTLTLSNNAFNQIGGSASTVVLTNNATIQGSGNIGSVATPIGLVNNGTINANQSTPLTINAAASGFNNVGTLTVGSGDKLSVNGTYKNFSGTTLTGGTYNVSGIFQFPGANIVTNAANITLTGAAAKILNSTTMASGLANFAANASTGTFSLKSGSALTTAGAFSNAGNFIIGSGSSFTLGGVSNFTQTAGNLTDDGTLKTSGTMALNGGNLIGMGVIQGALQSSGTITPGDSTTSTGILTDTGAYTQKATGVLDVSIGGTTAGKNFDVLNSTTAALGGTLNIKLINGFVPAIGSVFKILNYNSETGQFAKVNGLAINGSEHFTITYQGTDVLLTVVAGMAPAAAVASPTAAFTQIASSMRRGVEGGTIQLIGPVSPPDRASNLHFAAPGVTSHVGSMLASAGLRFAPMRSFRVDQLAFTPSHSSFDLRSEWTSRHAGLGATLRSFVHGPSPSSPSLSTIAKANVVGARRSHGYRGNLATRAAGANLHFSWTKPLSKPDLQFAVE